MASLNFPVCPNICSDRMPALVDSLDGPSRKRLGCVLQVCKTYLLS
jgi:hypothetical protein